MATNFPSSLDALTNPTGSDTLASLDHAGQHADSNDAIEALQAKVGVDSSAVTSSLDYKVAQKVDKSLVDAKGDLIVASADNTVSRLAVGATNGHVLTVDSAETLGVKWDAASAAVTGRLTSDFNAVTVVNTTADTSVLTYSLSSPVANERYELTAFGTQLNNSGGNVNYQYFVKVGATTVVTTDGKNFASAANRRKWRFVVDLFFDSTTVQEVSGFFTVSNAGTMTAPQATANSFAAYSTCTEDFATAKNVVVSVKMGTASASADFVLEGFYIQKVGP